MSLRTERAQAREHKRTRGYVGASALSHDLAQSWRSRLLSLNCEWARTVSTFRQGDNPARWRGHLENLLANPNKIAPVQNHPALPWREILAFMSAPAGREGVAARAA
jgi:hypothetical protein